MFLGIWFNIILSICMFFLCVVFQAAQSQSEQAGNICQQFLNRDKVQSLAEQSPKEAQTSLAPYLFVPGDREQSAPVMYTRQVSYPEKSGHIEEDPRKSAAAAVAAKLTASTSSVQMLSYVLSSLASEGVIGNSMSHHLPPRRLLHHCHHYHLCHSIQCPSTCRLLDQ